MNACRLTTAERTSHVRHKILPRPPQDVATDGANSLHALLLPVTSRISPCYYGTFSLLPLSIKFQN